MTSHPLFPRVTPFAWLLLQTAAVVASILLAFSFDAWWDGRNEVAQKNSLLRSVEQDLIEELALLEANGKFHEASKKSAEALLAAIAAGRYDDPDKSLDRRLADLMWVVKVPESATLEAFLAGGYLADVENDELRQALIVRRAFFDGITWHFTRLTESFEQTATYLGRHASLVQISNDAAVHGMPGPAHAVGIVWLKLPELVPLITHSSSIGPALVACWYV